MSIEQENVLDFVGVDKLNNEVVLAISDHLSWSEEVEEHIFKLQEKINKYIAAIESGELVQKYPESKNKKPVIKIVGKYNLPENELVKNFYEKSRSVVQWAGLDLRFEYLIFEED